MRDHALPPRSCDYCEDVGWVWVTEGYATRMVPEPTEATAAALGTTLAALAAKADAARAAARDSVYPCRHCNTDLFYRWAGGHLHARHDRSRCSECIDLTGRTQRRPRPAPPPQGPDPASVGADRKDLR